LAYLQRLLYVFNERGIDWDEQYSEFEPYVNDELSNDDLIEVLEALLEPLDDGHIQLNTGDGSYSFDEYRGENRVIFESFQGQTEYADIQDYANAVSSKYKEIRSSYLDTEKSAGGKEGNAVIWGTIGHQVGYLRVARMEKIASDEDSIEANLTAISTIMKHVLNDLQDTSALIIDVRVNGGGEGAISLAIASYFADQKRLAVSKYVRSYKGNTDPIDVYLEPANTNTYTNPVAVIGSPDTASAAEIFLMTMSTLPYVTLVAENSNGIHSDILSKSLPNGWEIGLSNEVYTDYLGVNHEVTGVPPVVQAPTFSLEAMAEDSDPAIDASLETLGFGELKRN
jgi:C-terminal processing protease CtpA/Prc